MVWMGNKNVAQNAGVPIDAIANKYLSYFMPPESSKKLAGYLNRLREKGEAVGTTYIYNKHKNKTR